MNHQGFEVAYYINLPHRADRKAKFEKMAKFLPVQKVIRFEGINGSGMGKDWPGTPGMWGCRESHIRVLEMAQKEGLQKFMVFEDDAIIKKTFTKKFNAFLNIVGDDWDMLYLYAKNHYLKPIKLNKNVMQLQNTLGLVGTVYNARNIDVIVNKLKNDYRWVDSCMADLHVVLKVYAPVKSLIIHPEGFSDNNGAFTKSDKNIFEESYLNFRTRFGPPVKSFLKKTGVLK